MKAWLKQTDKEPVPGPVAVPDVGGGGALASDQGALKRLVEDVFEFDVVGGFRDYCEGTQVRFLQHTLALPCLYFTLEALFPSGLSGKPHPTDCKSCLEVLHRVQT